MTGGMVCVWGIFCHPVAQHEAGVSRILGCAFWRKPGMEAARFKGQASFGNFSLEALMWHNCLWTIECEIIYTYIYIHLWFPFHSQFFLDEHFECQAFGCKGFRWSWEKWDGSHSFVENPTPGGMATSTSFVLMIGCCRGTWIDQENLWLSKMRPFPCTGSLGDICSFVIFIFKSHQHTQTCIYYNLRQYFYEHRVQTNIFHPEIPVQHVPSF